MGFFLIFVIYFEAIKKIMVDKNITYAIQVKTEKTWCWSLYYDKPFTSIDDAKKVLQKAREPKKSAWQYRIVQIIPLDE